MDNITLSEIPVPTFVPGWTDPNSILIPYCKLGQTDMIVSLFGLGAAHIGQKLDTDDVDSVIYRQKVIETAIQSGINLIDTSPFYGMGKSEMIVGQALKNIPRKAYYISTKVGRFSDCKFNYEANAVKRSIENSLKVLHIDYIDILYVHDVEFCPDLEILFNQTLPTIDLFRKRGQVRYIGISGYPLSLLKTIIENSPIKIDLVLSYCRHTLWDNELINYLDFFERKNVGIINAAIFGMGLFAESIPEWHPAPANIRQACQKARSFINEQKHKDTCLYRLALRHSLREKRIHTHLIGMECVEMIKQNLSLITNDARNEDEEQLVDQLLQNIFNNSSNNWENIELDRYRNNPNGYIAFLQNCWNGCKN